jgi:hypothetical protein
VGVSVRGQSPVDGDGVVVRGREGVCGSQRRDNATGDRATSGSVSGGASRYDGGREGEAGRRGRSRLWIRASETGRGRGCLGRRHQHRALIAAEAGVEGGHRGRQEREHGLFPIVVRPSTYNSSRDY